MLYGTIENWISQPQLDEKIRKVLTWVQAHDLKQLANGCHEIEGKDLFVNVIEYTTTVPENRIWEAHRDYLDVHVPIAGTEQLDLNFVENMNVEPYQPQDDYVPMTGQKLTSTVLQPGTFLVCWPEDAHRTGVQADQPEKIKKAVFKVRIA